MAAVRRMEAPLISWREALAIGVVIGVATCVLELPRDSGGNGQTYSAPEAANPGVISAPGGFVPPGHVGPNPGHGPDGSGPPGQSDDKPGKGPKK